jgi:hypothetical protein
LDNRYKFYLLSFAVLLLYAGILFNALLNLFDRRAMHKKKKKEQAKKADDDKKTTKAELHEKEYHSYLLNLLNLDDPALFGGRVLTGEEREVARKVLDDYVEQLEKKTNDREKEVLDSVQKILAEMVMKALAAQQKKKAGKEHEAKK